MCGIAGAISLDQAEANKTVVETMSLAVAHRGPDGQGLYCSADKKVIFAQIELPVTKFLNHLLLDI